MDASRDSVKVLEKNVAATGFQDRSQIVPGDYAVFLAGNSKPFDIAFLDPPYPQGDFAEGAPLTARQMNPGGVILCEHPLGEELPERAGEFQRGKSYRYGKIMLTVYRREEEA